MVNVGAVNFIVDLLEGKPLTFNPGDIIRAEVVDLLPSGAVILRLKGMNLPARSEIPLQIGQILTLEVKETLKEGLLKLQLIGSEIVNREVINKILKELESSLSRGLLKVNASKIHDLTLQLLKRLPEDLSLLQPEIRARIASILLKGLVSGRTIDRASYLNILEDSGMRLIDVSLPPDLTGEDLKALIINSGILFESRLRSLVKENNLEEKLMILLKEDPKAVILKLSEAGKDKAITELLRQIETYQTISKVTNSIYTFLPFLWKELKYGDISFKGERGGRGDRIFSCRLNLDLINCGRLTVMVTLHYKDLFISFMVEDEGFKKIIEENLYLLKGSFIGRMLNIRTINVMDLDAEATWPPVKDGIDLKV